MQATPESAYELVPLGDVNTFTYPDAKIYSNIENYDFKSVRPLEELGFGDLPFKLTVFDIDLNRHWVCIIINLISSYFFIFLNIFICQNHIIHNASY